MKRYLVGYVVGLCLVLVGCTNPPTSPTTTTTTSSVPSGPVELIVAGDSLSAMPTSYGVTYTWPALLPFNVANTARGGAAFTYVNNGIPKIGDALMTYIDANGCDVPVVVLGGTNDFRVGVQIEDFLNNGSVHQGVRSAVEELASQLATLECQTLWVTTVPAPSFAFWADSRYQERSSWNQLLRSAGVNLSGGLVADCALQLEGSDGFTAVPYVLSTDALHLNQAGQYNLSACIDQALTDYGLYN